MFSTILIILLVINIKQLLKNDPGIVSDEWNEK